MSLHSSRHWHLGLTCSTSSFWPVINVPEETTLSWGVWTTLLRLFIKVRTKLKQLIGCARGRVAWQHSGDSWAVLMTIWRFVVSELVKNFSLKMGASGVQGAKLPQGSGETTVGARGRQMILHSRTNPEQHIQWQVNEKKSGHFGGSPPSLISLSSKEITAKDWSKTQSTLCSFVLPIPNELTFSTAFLCCTLRHFSLNKLFTGITLVSLYLHWLLGTTFALLLISPGDLRHRYNTAQLYTKLGVHLPEKAFFLPWLKPSAPRCIAKSNCFVNMLGNTVLQNPTHHCAHPSFMGEQGEKRREEEARRWRGRKAPLRSHHPNGEDIPLCPWKTRHHSGNTKYSHASVQLHPLLPSLQFSSSSAAFCFRVQKGRN